MELPTVLQPYAALLAETKKPSLKIHGKQMETTTLQSKFAGNPYWLKTEPYPTSKSGEPLRLLAQINFSEIQPALPDYPTEGILQFFAANDGVYGLNFDDMTEQDAFRIVYHEKIEMDEGQWLTEFPAFNDDYAFSIEKECALTFEQTTEIIPASDYRFNLITNMNQLFADATDGEFDEYNEAMENYFKLASGQGSKIGGYPFFTQEDPRAYGEYQTYDTLLLQIDTDDELDIMWGDSGVANFLISLDDLKKRNFSNVVYNWDCY